MLSFRGFWLHFSYYVELDWCPVQWPSTQAPRASAKATCGELKLSHVWVLPSFANTMEVTSFLYHPNYCCYFLLRSRGFSFYPHPIPVKRHAHEHTGRCLAGLALCEKQPRPWSWLRSMLMLGGIHRCSSCSLDEWAARRWNHWRHVPFVKCWRSPQFIAEFQNPIGFPLSQPCWERCRPGINLRVRTNNWVILKLAICTSRCAHF